jgi:hypothetical protein
MSELLAVVKTLSTTKVLGLRCGPSHVSTTSEYSLSGTSDSIEMGNDDDDDTVNSRTRGALALPLQQQWLGNGTSSLLLS